MDSAAEGESAYRGQAGALAWMMAAAAAQAAEKLGALLPRGARLLDLGAGSGVWSLTLLAGLPEAAATLVDRSGVLEVARPFARRAGVESRVRFEPGNYHELELPEEAYDLVILANVCHLETAPGNRRLFARAARWLKPGGRIAVLDVSPEAQPLAAALNALGLALRTEAAAVPTAAQFQTWLRDSGFSVPDFSLLPAPPGTMGLWTAVRP